MHLSLRWSFYCIFTMKPDFSKYSLNELKESLNSIDRARFPERVKELENLIRAKSLLPTSHKEIPQKPVTIFHKPLILSINLLSVFFILGLGVAAKYNEIEIRTFFICFCAGWFTLSLINLMQPWVKPIHKAIYIMVSVFVLGMLFNAM